MHYLSVTRCCAAGLLALALGCGGSDYDDFEPAATSEGSGGSPGAPAGAVEQVDPATAATVAGVISFEGDPVKLPRLNMSAEPDCLEMHDAPPMANNVIVTDGKLQDVMIWIKSGLEGKKFAVRTDKVALDQIGCMYKPRMVGVQASQTLTVTNSDPTTHNVHPLPKSNREWNRSQTPGGAAIDTNFPRAEMMIPVKCNIHPWMIARICVIDHPYFSVTGSDGAFEIKNLPPGTYTLEAIHDRLGAKEMEIVVEPSESKQVDFTFTS